MQTAGGMCRLFSLATRTTQEKIAINNGQATSGYWQQRKRKVC